MNSDRNWLAAFLEAQAAELGAAQNTLTAYARDLGDFTEWLESTQVGHSRPTPRMSVSGSLSGHS